MARFLFPWLHCIVYASPNSSLGSGGKPINKTLLSYQPPLPNLPTSSFPAYEIDSWMVIFFILWKHLVHPDSLSISA